MIEPNPESQARSPDVPTADPDPTKSLDPAGQASTDLEALKAFPVTRADQTSPCKGPRGKFTILRRHAVGGLGQVSLARDDSLGRQVALKEIRPDRLHDPALRQRFITEAEIT